ncbi:MAG: hypothetical protein GF417_07770 [Candidatus Latescibacteria bacterium]|nr:hypothetical protein [bacterium]MBD3424317.1 hypothetical protein [Candidatus Latescibacterota bacterium]
MVENLPDLYNLERDDIRKLQGFAEKSAGKLYRNIQNSRNPSLDRFIYALGIRHVGEHVARVLAREFGSLDKIRDAARDELEDTGEIGPEIAESIYHFFRDKRNRESLEGFYDAGLKIRKVEMERGELPLDGKRFVFTGELESCTRKEAIRKVESMGGRVTSSVSSRTDYLVRGSGPGSKLDEAEEKGVKILQEDDFISMMEDES